MKISLINAIIFDFGGVFVNWDPHHLYNKYFGNDAHAIDAFLAEIQFASWNLHQDQGRPFALGVKELSARFPQYEHLIRAYDEEWEQSIIDTIPGTVEKLERLKSAGYHLYGLTNWSAEKFHNIRGKYRVFDFFEDIVVSGEVNLIKPDPAIFNLLLERIHRQPYECLLVDDSQHNLEIAKTMGFSTIHFTSPNQLESELQRIGVL